MRRALRVIALVAVVGVGPGCDPEPDAPTSVAGPSDREADVVATVGGRPVDANEVRARMVLEGLDAEQALTSLVNEQLLLVAAERARVGAAPEGLRAADRRMVRAFLRDLEADHQPADVAATEVRNHFEEHRDAYQVMERRAATHLLVKSDTSDTPAARAVAKAAIVAAQGAEDPVEGLRMFLESRTDDHEFAMALEELPPITRKAEIEKPFIDAIFGVKSRGALATPVRTSYGWHAIVVTDIAAGEDNSLADVEDDIRDRLSDQARFEALVAVVQGLEAEGLVEHRPEVRKRVLRGPGANDRAQ
ncbi:MAG: peptidyl-prolyl cis-trans isomerase [Myxococcota bacterium]